MSFRLLTDRSLHFSYKLVVLLPILLLSATTPASGKLQPTVPRPDPFVDPKHDPYNPLRYICSDTLTSIALALCLSTAFFMTFATFKWGAKYMLAMVIGAYTFCIGLGLRYGMSRHPQSKGIYIAEYLFIVLSPCAFIAADYVLLSRLAKYVSAGDKLLIRPERLAIVFVSSDIGTFLIQAIGGSVSVSANDMKKNKVGSRIFLVGLVLQLLSFSIFTVLYLHWIYRLKTQSSAVWNAVPWNKSWKLIVFSLLFSCVGILIRSAFRVAESSQGYRGHLATSEPFFYALDTLPLFMAIVVYVPFWPGRVLVANDPTPKNDAIEFVVMAPVSSEALKKSSGETQSTSA